MSNKIATAALAAVLSVATVIPSAYADRSHGRHFNGHAYNDHHRGRGYWHNGRWVALGILGAAAAAAANDYNDCYWRHGRRYCY
jgi:hypothetical protein